MEEIQISYFTFKNDIWNSFAKRIELNANNINGLLEKIENGGNLFEVVPGFEKEMLENSRLSYASFETRKRAESGENYENTPDTMYTQVGKLLVPEYKIISKEGLESRMKDAKRRSMKSTIQQTISKHPSASQFHHEGWNTYVPLDKKQVFVLEEGQL